MSKILLIRWYHLEVDGQTCSRCQQTKSTLSRAIEHLAPACRSAGWQISVEDIILSVEQIELSNRVEIAGRPIEDIIDIRTHMNVCDSCSHLTGKKEFCRSVEYQGKMYDDIPYAAFLEAIRKVTSLTTAGPTLFG